VDVSNLLLTHLGNFKWTHPDIVKRKKAFHFCGELATALICNRAIAFSKNSVL
jgi:hypothetical protein